jgi:tetratricopeptide (TPR) repeat protein
MDFGAGVLADITDSGLAGTPLYLAPEVLAGAPQTIKSDIFSAGVLAFHLATGSFPYHTDSVAGLNAAHRAGRSLSLRDVRPDLPSRLAAAIEQALAPDPAQRYPSAAAFADALDVFLQPRVPPWLFAVRAALMLTGVTAVLSGGLFAASLAGQSGDRERQAFILYFQGLELARERTATSLSQSLRYYQDALSLQPDFARAHAAMAEAYTVMGIYATLPRRVAHAKATEHAELALALDPGLWEVHRSLGYARKNVFRWNESEASFKEAIAINPTDGQTHHWYSILLTQLGRLDEAASEIALAQSLLPQSLPARLQHAAVLQMRRRYDASIAEYEAVLAQLGHTEHQADDGTAAGARPLCGSLGAKALAGNLVTLTRRHLAKTYALSGDHDRAIRQLTALECDSSGGFEDHELQADLGWAFAMAGDEQSALAIVSKLEDRFHLAGEQVAASIAAIYAGLNRRDDAFVWLDRAVADEDPGVGYLKTDPRWDRLRADHRLDRLLAVLMLPQEG